MAHPICNLNRWVPQAVSELVKERQWKIPYGKISHLYPGGGTRMARGGIRLVHGLTKSTLITYFSGMKKDPKYAFLHAFFLICLSCSFQNLSIWPKNTLFSNFARFCTPKRCMCVQYLVLKNNPNYVNFWTSLMPPWHLSAPPGNLMSHKLFLWA